MTMPRLPPQGHPSTQIQVAYYSENLATLGAGAKGYTGIGFKPRTLEIMARVIGTSQVGSFGFSDQHGHVYAQTLYEWNLRSGATTFLVYIFGTSAWFWTAAFTSYDADGFTLTWALTGVGPAGTLEMIVRAMS
jgi:hypothetical protein